MMPEPRMLQVGEYAELHGFKPDTVRYWCHNNRLPGMQIIETGRKAHAARMYLIPEDAIPITRTKKADQKQAQPETPKTVIQVQQKPVERGPQRLKHLQTEHDKSEHIRKFAVVRSYRQLCIETGLTHMEVRRIYDRLHQRYGI